MQYLSNALRMLLSPRAGGLRFGAVLWVIGLLVFLPQPARAQSQGYELRRVADMAP